jgi:bifunctional DNA-binding transcriptional regulator/antitoxin component of YhaV-PrlF toxin-antitoxin module
VVVPAAIRRELELEPGEVLVAQVEDGKVVMEKLKDVRSRRPLRGRWKRQPGSPSLTDELLAERREEARREASEG